MAEQNNTIKTTIILDATQAQQQIIKLNAIASDTTKSLEERVEAKNKQVELQNKLSKQAISSLEKEIKELKKLEGTEKEVVKVQKKLNSARIKSTRISVNGAKQQAKFSQSLKDSKDSMKGLDDATGGVIGKFKAFIANPIGLTIAALAGLFKLFQTAVNRSGKATTTFSKIGAKLSGIFNGLMAVLAPIVEFIGEKLLSAMEDPVQAIKDLGQAIIDNVINRFKSILVLGDAIVELFKGNFKAAGKLAADALLQFSTGVTDATDKMADFLETAKVAFKEAADATDLLVDAEKRLVQNRIALEKLQLTSLRLAEEQRQVRDNTSKSIEERIEANKELGRILDKQSKAELALAQQALDIARAQKTATGDTIENIEAVGDAEIKLLEIQERISGQRSEQIVNEIGLRQEQIDLGVVAAEAQLELDALELERRKLQGEDVLQLELDLLNRKKEQDLTNLKLTEEEKAFIIAESNAASDELKLERLERETEAQLQLDEMDLQRRRDLGETTLADELDILNRRREQELSNADLTGKEREVIEAKYDNAITASKEAALEASIGMAADAFGIAKEVAVAKMIMNAPEAVSNVWTQAAKQPTLPQVALHGISGTIMTLGPIVKGLADIKKNRFPGKSKAPRSGTSGSISTSTGGGGVSGISSSVIEDITANNSARLGIDPSLGQNATASAANNIIGGATPQIIFSESSYNDFQNQVDFKEEKTLIG